MRNKFKQMTRSETWGILAGAATKGLREQGYNLRRLPGRGRSNVYEAELDGQKSRVSVRTTKDRYFAFPPIKDGTKWKTLDEADLVVVATTNSRHNPQKVEVYLFDAAEVRERFDSSYKARIKAKRKVRDGFGMWLCLDRVDRGNPRDVGTGLGDDHPPIAVYSIDELISGDSGAPASIPGESHEDEPTTIAEVVNWTRQRIASLAGVETDAVKLDLKIEY